MFTIDLLKGRGIPARSRPKGIIIMSATLVVPLVIAIALFGFYLCNSIIISIHKQEMNKQQAAREKLSAVVKLQKSLEKEKSDSDSCLSEVKHTISRHTQWSGVLEELVENMPNTVVLTELEVRQTFIKSRMAQKDSPKEMVDITIPARTLHMSVYGASQSNGGETIREFRDRLLRSAILASRVEDIRVSQKSTQRDGQSFVSYDIDCIFKPGM